MKLPNWKTLSHKKIVRLRHVYEVTTFLSGRKNLASLHLPGSSMLCVLFLEAAKAKISHYFGIEWDSTDKEIDGETHECEFNKLKKTLARQPKNLQKKCHFIKGKLIDLFLAQTTTRYKVQPPNGIDFYYLDLISTFSEETRSTLVLLASNTGLRKKVLENNENVLLQLTLSIRGNGLQPEETSMLRDLTEEHPEFPTMIKEGHKGTFLLYTLGVQTFLNRVLALNNLEASATHRIIYREKGAHSAIMVSLGFLIQRKQKTHKPETIVYLGIENKERNHKNLLKLLEWQEAEVFQEDMTPDRHLLHDTIRVLHKEGISAEKIAEMTTQEKDPIDKTLVEKILKLPAVPLQEESLPYTPKQRKTKKQARA